MQRVSCPSSSGSAADAVDACPRERIVVRSSKAECTLGEEICIIPILPEPRPNLQELRDLLPEDDPNRIITHQNSQYVLVRAIESTCGGSGWSNWGTRSE
ncbi:MAG: hypothetical protein RMJ88_04175 [Thermogemmata sp.]|nr:hypothetical protein [Thermogemmata sp.]